MRKEEMNRKYSEKIKKRNKKGKERIAKEQAKRDAVGHTKFEDYINVPKKPEVKKPKKPKQPKKPAKPKKPK